MQKISIPENKWKFLAKGKRSQVYTSIFKKKKVVIKVYKDTRDLKNLAANEAKNLILLNKYGIGPRIIYHDSKKIIYYFVQGQKILDYLKSAKITDIKTTIKKTLDICFVLDNLNINKKEMSHPTKHILINKNKISFIDFERASNAKKPKNTSQFYDFLLSKTIKEILEKKKIKINKDLKFIRNYKLNQNKKTYEELIENIFVK